ncbi:VCBS repeat-containing protein, partial [Escherichia coli]|nr:VCBS repeat-containing protein [Escherichia coli]
TGEGGFGSPIVSPAGAPNKIAAADFDGDGKLDLAVAQYNLPTVSILRGRGNGRFEAPVSFPAGGDPLAVIARDLDADGFADVAVTTEP